MVKAKKSFSPKNLQALLGFILFVAVAGGAGLFYLGLQEVKAKAVQVNHVAEDAKASAKQIEELQTLRAQLNEGSSLIDKANLLFSTPAAYQSQVYSDVRAYASRTGVTIESTTFNDVSATGKYSVTVKVKNPTSYPALIRFLHLVETSVPKLQVTALSLSHTSGKPTADNVTVGDIQIEVLTR